LREAGHEVEDVRDVGLRGQSDDDIFVYTQARDAPLIAAKKDFADILRFRPGTHAGIVVVRVPNVLPKGAAL
jgi:predicted nuclease of predicted toxin-antitoxin system